MENHFISYKTVPIIFLFFALTLCSSCGKNEDSWENPPSLSLPSSISQETEETPAQPSAEEMETGDGQPTGDAGHPEANVSQTGPNASHSVITEVNWENYFDGLNGAAVVYTPSENSYEIFNLETALARRSPCSTFKIISSLIALENGIVEPDNSVRTWSREVFWNENWNRDMEFEDAFRASCVWYYRKIIDEIGKDRMQEALNRLDYGNRDISDWEGRLNTNNNNPALTGFWIESSLKISPKEQTEVMERIFGENSIYSSNTQNQLKQVMLVSESSDISIYGKTGMGKAKGVVADAWFTGFSDTMNGRKYFCVYLGETEGKNVSSTKAKEIAVAILSDLGGA